MSIKLEDLSQIEFAKTFRGYDKASVDHFIGEISKEFQQMLAKIDKLEDNLNRTERELNRLKEVEMVMLKTIKEADAKAEQIILNAQNEAEAHLLKAKEEAENTATKAAIDADDLILEAKDQARTITLQAKAESEALLRETNETIEALKTEAKIDLEASEIEYNSLDFAKKQLIEDLNSLLGNTNARLSNIAAKYNPETFNARKISLTKLRKAGLMETQKTEEKPTEKEVKAKKPAKVEKIKQAKAPKVVSKPVKKAKSVDDEDQELPTVSKILAAEANKNAEVPMPSVESNNTENASFFDLI